MFFKSILILVGFLPSTVFADIVITRDIFVTLEELSRVEASLKKLQVRPSPRDEYAADGTVDDHLVFLCPAKLPNADGRGCTMAFTMDFSGPAKITITKDLDVYNKVDSMKKTLAESTATPGEHVQLGTIFTEASSEGSHVYCVAGQNPQDWTCVLSVIEKF